MPGALTQLGSPQTPADAKLSKSISPSARYRLLSRMYEAWKGASDRQGLPEPYGPFDPNKNGPIPLALLPEELSRSRPPEEWLKKPGDSSPPPLIEILAGELQVGSPVPGTFSFLSGPFRLEYMASHFAVVDTRHPWSRIQEALKAFRVEHGVKRFSSNSPHLLGLEPSPAAHRG